MHVVMKDRLACSRAVELIDHDDTLAFMDVMPQSPGHTLVIPKAAAENLYDLDPAAGAAVLATVQSPRRSEVRMGMGAASADAAAAAASSYVCYVLRSADPSVRARTYTGITLVSYYCNQLI